MHLYQTLDTYYFPSVSIKQCPRRQLPRVSDSWSTLQTKLKKARFNDVSPSDLSISRLQRRTSETVSFVRKPSLSKLFSPFEHDSLAGVGGVLLSPESVVTPDAEKKMVGSMFICEANNIEE